MRAHSLPESIAMAATSIPENDRTQEDSLGAVLPATRPTGYSGWMPAAGGPRPVEPRSHTGRRAYVNDWIPTASTTAPGWRSASPAEFTPPSQFLRFDLSGIPIGASVNSAALRLNLQAYENTAPAEIEEASARPVGRETLTWNNQPASTPPITSTVVGVTST
jgi:hypothetical protein